MVVGTKTGLRDVAASFEIKSSPQLITEEIRVYERGILLNDLKKALTKHEPSAFAIVRGGDDETLNIWDNPGLIEELVKLKTPFYLALGHSHRLTLSDKYADEVFHTPSNFGFTLAQHCKNKVTQDFYIRNAQELQAELNTLRSKPNKTIARLKKAIWALILILLFAGVYIYLTY